MKITDYLASVGFSPSEITQFELCKYPISYNLHPAEKHWREFAAHLVRLLNDHLIVCKDLQDEVNENPNKPR